ncbi:uncharacterized protein LOC131018833 [Salvia miltiorrhiza]|uniref:uncharacterized protein LOC131018833 n=1 Tax=Salvia miltiorrhiza TaxID=226208 RepID=UPI0025AC1967|nr:uncharacterized protein LOC131018833 [Salvia miltiorrhiza]
MVVETVFRLEFDHNRPDSRIWVTSKDGMFHPRDLYFAIANASTSEEQATDHWPSLWWKAIPLKVSAFVWKALLDRLPTKDNLIKRGILHSQEDGVCSLCWVQDESSCHVLLICYEALLVWSKVCGWIDCSLLYAATLKEHFEEFVSFGVGKVKKKILGLIWQCVVWRIWKARNEKIFKNSIPIAENIVESIKFCSWKWLKAHYPSSFYASLHEWSSHPILCMPTNL